MKTLVFGFIFSGISVIDALVLSTIWKWYVVPTFDLPILSLGSAYGLMLIFSMVRGLNFNKKGEGDGYNIFVVFFVSRALIMIFGYIGTYFI
jgi:hypothetical protein